ncbi:hypothetical protein UFOVP318_9 [uncultured Caudovirales phage]|uniref:Uncharacterized protein n=1 Tax=uncultured Caudovirales phage TaxID=2100421 RepID=A0A6J5LSM8_9CAUD|nr:hypothetical protein UFOVP318_9 [uncultured Caudovirales phage]
MAKKEVGVKVKVDTGEAQDSVGKLNEDLKKTGQAADKAGDAAKKSTGMFSTLGNAVKALGIVTVIAGAFNFFREALGKNQKVADTLAAVFGTIASVLNQLVNIVIDATTEVGKSTNGFDALGKVMDGLLRVVINPFKLSFFGIKLAIQGAQLAWEKSPFGNGDPGRIKELNDSISETAENLKNTAVDQFEAGKQIITNFVDAASSIGDVVTKTIDGTKKINIGATFEQQKAIVSLKNNAELAAATLGGLIEKYDRLAEQQRQIRDDETKSIDERIKANEELGKTLELQRKAQLAQAAQILAAAQAEANADKTNIQLQKAVIEAKNNVAGVEAQITGLLSEQKVNAIGLAKIKIELGKQETQATNQRLLNEQKAAVELIKNENDKLAAKKKIFEEESKLEIARLEANVKATNAGTEARKAAEIELANKKSELAIQGQALDQQILETGLNKQLEQINKQKEIYQMDFQMRADLINQEAALLEEQFQKKLITDEQYLAAKRNITAQENQLEIDKLNAKKQAVDGIISLFGAETNVGRAALIVKQVLAAQEMIMEAKKTIFFGKSALAKSAVAVAEGSAQTAKIGFPQNIPMLIGYAVQAAGIIMAIRQAVKGIGGATGNMGGSPPPPNITAPVTPALAPQVVATQVNTAAVNQMGNRAARAYVLNSDIQNDNQRNAYIDRNASIG